MGIIIVAIVATMWVLSGIWLVPSMVEKNSRLAEKERLLKSFGLEEYDSGFTSDCTLWNKKDTVFFPVCSSIPASVEFRIKDFLSDDKEQVGDPVRQGNFVRVSFKFKKK